MSQLIFHSSRLKRNCWIIYESELTLILWHKCCITLSKRAEPLHYSIIYSLTCNIHYHRYGWHRYRYLNIQNLWASQMIILEDSVNWGKQRGKCIQWKQRLCAQNAAWLSLPGHLCNAPTSQAKLFLCPKSGPLQSKSLFSPMLNLISQMKWNEMNFCQQHFLWTSFGRLRCQIVFPIFNCSTDCSLNSKQPPLVQLLWKIFFGFCSSQVFTFRLLGVK